MSIDEQMELHMEWWIRGAKTADHGEAERPVFRTPERERAFEAGYAAYLVAAETERARLERCPVCEGRKMGKLVLEGVDSSGRSWAHTDPCPECKGTGKRNKPS